MIKIGFLGPEGTFSQNAAVEYMKNKGEYEGCAYATIQDVIEAVARDDVDMAIAPIENSLEGPVNITLDMLAFSPELKIKAEIVMNITQNLMVRKGTAYENIRHIISHPQPVGQCNRFLAACFPHAQITLVSSTAEGAKRVAEGGYDSAAIGSANLAGMYGLEIINEGIEDNNNNSTRFVVIAKQDEKATGCDKTSIVFSTDDKPGNLYRILDIFNLWDINMTRIESRPAKSELGKYVFFVDLNGHKDDADINAALTMVKRKTSFYKFLGSYPLFVKIG